MPKRVIDGDGLWRSDKLSMVEPAGRRAEYANLLPLALSNGVFEANPRRIWAMVYSYNRPDVTPEDVVQILDEFERVKLLFRWSAADGKVWGYWTGIEKPGRLPGVSRRGKNEPVGPEPPQDSMRKFLDSNEIHTETIEQPSGTDLRLGFGSGLGLGLGSGTDSYGIREQTTPSSKNLNPTKVLNAEPNAVPNGSSMPGACERQTQPSAATAEKSGRLEGFNSTEIAQAICSANGWSGRQMIWAFQEAIDFQSAQMPEASLEQVGEWLVTAYFDRRSSKGDFAGSPQKFFEQALYRSGPNRRANGKATASSDDLVARTVAQLEAK